MASFNQNPLGQTSLAVTALSVTLGSAAHNAGLVGDVASFSSDASGIGDTVIDKILAVTPLWRRESKILSANQ